MVKVEEIAASCCTTKELAAFVLWNRGAGYRRIADLLGVSTSTARDRVERARRKVIADPRFKGVS